MSTPPSQHHANATKNNDGQGAFDQGSNDFLFHRFLSFKLIGVTDSDRNELSVKNYFYLLFFCI